MLNFRRTLLPIYCCFCLSSLFAEQEGIRYNLVSEHEDVYITKKTEQIGTTFVAGNVFDKQLIAHFYNLIKQSKNDPIVVLDVGAQTGSFTLLAKYLPHSKWYAFEAVEEIADELKRNLDLNAIDNVSVFSKAVSNSSQQKILKLPIGESWWGGATLGDNPLRFPSWTDRAVDCIALDDFIREHDIPKVDFIKVDVEGWELNVLVGAEFIINRDRPIMLLEFCPVNMQQCNINPDDLMDFLESHDYSTYRASNEDIICIPIERM